MLEEAYWRTVHAFNRRDLAAWLELMDKDVDVESRFSSVGTNFRGHAAVRRWWDDLADAWEFIEVEPELVRQVAPSQTLALLCLNAKGRESGLEVREPTAHRVDWRDGRWLRLRYVDRRAAEEELAAIA